MYVHGANRYQIHIPYILMHMNILHKDVKINVISCCCSGIAIHISAITRIHRQIILICTNLMGE